MTNIRVLITDDSSMARSLLRAFLEDETGIEIVGEASNGRQAVDMARELKPNLITMDLEMPVMNGMDAIEEIMCSKAVPILVVSSVADAQNALEAVGRGALEVVRKPDYSPEEAADFVAKVRMLAGVSVITRMRPRVAPIGDLPPLPMALPTFTAPPVPPILSSSGLAHYSHIFAIASSTGGPQALAQLLPALPAGFPAPVVIAQHISDGFAGGMAEWLNSLCQLPVRLASEGEVVQPGVIYISPSERHLSITSARRFTLVERGGADIYRPSCDVLLNSAAEIFGRNTIGIILTGMGNDGAKGMARIREKGGVTLGQDEATSVIYGMNRVAIESGAVQRVLPIESMAAAMNQLAGVFPVSVPA
jgi:two-component system chemotaxis response regulator CheB